MQRFTQLYVELDETNRTNEKVAALERYFSAAPPEDAAWALYFLTGRRILRAITGAKLRQWVADAMGLSLWLVEESYDAVGDLAETAALLLPEDTPATALPLHTIVAERIAPLPGMDEAGQRALVEQTWRELSVQQRFVWHKLITGEFRVGVGRTLVERALANVAAIPQPIMAHRLMGAWEPNGADFVRLLDPETQETHHSQPYPFYLAYQLDAGPASLGNPDEWQVEWKWDGIRAQVIHRRDEALVWTRGEELVTGVYPELERLARRLPDGTVLDGEILAWRDGRPLPFNVLQQRLGRKSTTPKLLREAPVALMVYDLLEWQGEDIRGLPLFERRAQLEELAAAVQPGEPAMQLSPIVAAAGWEEYAALRERSREMAAEGFMLKRRDAPYGVGRRKGDWWKWKIDPFTVDAVMIYAQRGHGRRASLYTDYTFAVWDKGELTPIAKAYSGLTDEEIRRVDEYVRRNTIERFGPVRVVKPELVFELAFEGIQASKRHKSGVALRFPRMARWRHDKQPQDADTLDTLRALLAQTSGQDGSRDGSQ